MTTTELAESAGKTTPFVRALQRKFGLPTRKAYPEGYAVLVRKLVYLSICSVPDRHVKSLLANERSLLELLKVDSVGDGPLWFESLCVMKSGPTRLLLSGYELGHPVGARTVQTGLDFSEREKELFRASEMGVDVLRELERYAEVLDRVLDRVRLGLPAARAALKWAGRVVHRDPCAAEGSPAEIGLPCPCGRRCSHPSGLSRSLSAGRPMRRHGKGVNARTLAIGLAASGILS